MPGSLALHLLGPIQLRGARRPLTTQQLALVTRLVCVGPARRETLVEALWGGRAISDARFANLVSEVRGSIGRHHLPVLADDHYRVIDLPTDLDVLLTVAGRPVGAEGRASEDAELEALESAVALIRGPVFSVSAERSWWWLDSHPEVVAQAEAAVGQVANRLVGLLRQQGDLDRAREICQRALAWCPLDRDLVVALEGLLRAQGRPASAHRLITSWRVQVHRLTGEDPQSLASV